MAALASKAESKSIFDKLNTKPANKVRAPISSLDGLRCMPHVLTLSVRSALIAAQRIQHGLLCPLPSTCVLTALPTIETLVFIFPLCAPRILIVCSTCADSSTQANKIHLAWQWDQLRLMKVGGNDSATKYFQSHGGTAALASKDPKTKYTSTAATKYKEQITAS